MEKQETKIKNRFGRRKGNPPDNAINGKNSGSTTKRLETVVAILLGLTTLLSAWATWIGSLHSGIQSINFTKSNNMSSKGSAEYNLGMQMYLSDYMVWNTLNDYSFELETAKASGDKENISIIKEKIKDFKKHYISETLRECIKWMEENNADNPFNMPGLSEKYFGSAEDKVNASQEFLEEGMSDNRKGDSYNLVTVIFSLTLFLLGIIGTFKNMPNRIAVLFISIGFLVFGAIYMFNIPLPTGFEKMNFFEFN